MHEHIPGSRGAVAFSSEFRRCLRDSRFLLEHGRSETAFILSILAAEELSKCVIIEWNKMSNASIPTRNHKTKQAAFGALSTSISLQDKMLTWAEKNGFEIVKQQEIKPDESVETEDLLEQTDLISFIQNSKNLQSEMRTYSRYILGVLENLKHGLLYGDFGVKNPERFRKADYGASAAQMLNDIDNVAERLATKHAGLLLVLSHSLFESWASKNGA